MRFTKLGAIGLDVSLICLGCISFGDSASGTHAWAAPGTPRPPAPTPTTGHV